MGVRRQVRGLTWLRIVIRDKGIVVEKQAGQGPRQLAEMAGKQTILQETRQSVGLAGALTAAYESTGRGGDVVEDSRVCRACAAAQETVLREGLVVLGGVSSASLVYAPGLQQDGTRE